MGKFSPNIIANSLLSLSRYNPSGEFLVYGDRRVTWGEMKRRSFQVAQALVRLGVKKNDKVAFMFYNNPEFVEINFGIQVAGAVPVPMNYRFTAREVEYQAVNSDAVLFLYEESNREAVEAAAPNLKNIHRFICCGPTEFPEAMSYEEFIASGQDLDPGVATDSEDVAVMIYTGGTTGFPKGVMLTYGAHIDMFASLFANMISRAAEINLTEEQLARIQEAVPIPGLGLLHTLMKIEAIKKGLQSPVLVRTAKRVFCYTFSHPEVARFAYHSTVKYMVPSMPFFHDASYQVLILAALAGNLCLALVPGPKFDPAQILELAAREKVVFMANVPTGWKKLISFPDFNRYDLSSLRIAANGGGAASAALKKQMFERMTNVIILDMFGQTEMTPITTFRLDADPAGLKDRSVGKSIVEVKVVDENGSEVPRGQVGEIMYRSSTVMKGYYKDADKTSSAMSDGWFKSGDLGYLDEEGEVRVIDRLKECINTGGEKVFPLEVEEVIHQHPGVDEVCIIGVPDEEWGCTVRAVVQLKRGEKASAAEIIEFCRRELAGFKCPRSVVFVDELPLSPVGKVLRAKIRERFGQPTTAND